MNGSPGNVSRGEGLVVFLVEVDPINQERKLKPWAGKRKMIQIPGTRGDIDKFLF